MFNNPEIRIHGTGSLFPIGQEDLLFHPRMIRTAGRGPDLSETNLGSRDAKPVQEIENTGVGEELTTCLKHPCFTLG